MENTNAPLQETISKVTAMGFDVWMRKPTDTWMLFTDGTRLGYLQYERLGGYSVCTVHMPNLQSGTGYQVARHISNVTKDVLLEAFQHAPGWAGDVSSVRKYKDIEHYRSANSFNAKYQLIAKGETNVVEA